MILLMDWSRIDLDGMVIKEKSEEIAQYRRLLRRASKPERARVCVWKWDDNDNDADFGSGWRPACDPQQLWSEPHDCGEPDEVYPHCPYCGGRIEVRE